MAHSDYDDFEFDSLPSYGGYDDDFQEGFVQLSLIDSAYAKVIFQDVKDVYPPTEDLVCTYIVASSTKPTAGDTVRLFKVGWSSVEDYVAAVSCVFPHNGKIEATVVFKALAIPDDDSNFYQFCYITADREIRGASTPFLFKSFSSEDLVTVNDIESDLLLIRTRTSLLVENLQKTLKEKNNSLVEKQNLEKDLKEQQMHIADLEISNAIMEKTITDMEERINNIETTLSANEKMLQTATTEKDKLLLNLCMLQKEKDKLKESLEETQKQFQDDQRQISHLMEENASKCLTIGSLLHQRKLLNSTIDFIEKEIKELRETLQKETNEKKQMASELDDTKSMLAAMEDSKCLALKELDEIKSKFASLTDYKMKLEIEIKTLKNNMEFESKKTEQRDKELDYKSSTILTLQSESDALKITNKTLEEKIAELETSVCDLHSRLQLGAEEYKLKYIEWFKLKKRLEKIESKLKKKTILKMDGCSSGSTEGPENSKKSNVENDADTTISDNSVESSIDDASNGIQVNAICPELKRALHSEMEEQLLKFQSSHNSSSCSTSADATVKHDNTQPALYPPYPYPPYYPYPYPNYQCQHVQRSSNASQHFLTHNSAFACNFSDNVIPTQPGRNQTSPTVEACDYALANDSIHCPVCDKTFVSGTDTTIINEHVEEHFTIFCSVCRAAFDRESQQLDFQRHISEHDGF